MFYEHLCVSSVYVYKNMTTDSRFRGNEQAIVTIGREFDSLFALGWVSSMYFKYVFTKNILEFIGCLY